MISAHKMLSAKGGHQGGGTPGHMKLGKEHILAAIILVVFAALAGLSIWLGRVSQHEPELINHYWPLLP